MGEDLQVSAKVRNLTRISTDEFKTKLDEYLKTIHDEPKMSNYILSTCNQDSANPYNSVIDLTMQEQML